MYTCTTRVFKKKKIVEYFLAKKIRGVCHFNGKNLCNRNYLLQISQHVYWLEHIKKWAGQLRLKSEVIKVTRNLFNNLNPSTRALTRH